MQREIQPGRRSAVLLLFALGGATSLAWEVLWFRRFAHLWGSSAEAFACVVSAFLLGLGLGAAWAGRRAAGSRRPLRTWAWCEAWIAGTALVLPFALELFGARVLGFFSAGTLPLGMRLPLRAATTFVLLAPATIAMGATLPFVVRHATRAGARLGRATSLAYGSNALGAALGAALVGFVSLPAIGFRGTEILTWFLNLALAGVIGWLARAEAPAEVASPVRAEVAPIATPPRARLCAAAACLGAGALVLQCVWMREAALVLGGSTYAFSGVLALYVGALGIGSLCFHAFAARAADLRPHVSIAVLVAVLGALLGQALLPELCNLAGDLRERRVSIGFDALFTFSMVGALAALPSLALGFLFPAWVELDGRARNRDETSVGSIYAWNTLGSISAVLGTQLWLLPHLGHGGAVRLALGLALVAVVLAWSPLVREPHVGLLATTALCILGLCVSPRAIDPLVTHTGAFWQSRAQREAARQSLTTLFFRSGACADVLVTGQHEDALPGDPRHDPNKQRTLWINGKPDASTTGDMPMQLGLAYYAHLAQPRARTVLVIGLGSGSTPGASLLFRGTRVTCCEIEPAVLEAEPFFRTVNHDPTSNPDFAWVADDARGFLAASSERWDLILAEPTNPWVAGVASLFTREAYLLYRARLSADGVLAQWVQTYSTDAATYASIARTILEVFPHVALLRITARDTLVLACAKPIFQDDRDLEAAQALIDGSREVQADLEHWFGTQSARALLAAAWLMDERALRRWIAAQGEVEVHTDAKMSLEFDAPRAFFASMTDSGLGLDPALVAGADLGLIERLAIGARAEPGILDGLRFRRDLHLQHGQLPFVQQLIELALLVDSDDAEFLADQVALSVPVDEEESAARVARLIELAPERAFATARLLAQNRGAARALPLFEALSKLHPTSVGAWNGLAVTYAALGREAQARAAIAQALAIDPLDPLAREFERSLDP